MNSSGLSTRKPVPIIEGVTMEKLSVNGRNHEVQPGTTLAQLLTQMQLFPEHVVTAVNGEIVATEHAAGKVLHDGDILDLMNFVGGG